MNSSRLLRRSTLYSKNKFIKIQLPQKDISNQNKSCKAESINSEVEEFPKCSNQIFFGELIRNKKSIILNNELNGNSYSKAILVASKNCALEVLNFATSNILFDNEKAKVNKHNIKKIPNISSNKIKIEDNLNKKHVANLIRKEKELDPPLNEENIKLDLNLINGNEIKTDKNSREIKKDHYSRLEEKKANDEKCKKVFGLIKNLNKEKLKLLTKINMNKMKQDEERNKKEIDELERKKLVDEVRKKQKREEVMKRISEKNLAHFQIRDNWEKLLKKEKIENKIPKNYFYLKFINNDSSNPPSNISKPHLKEKLNRRSNIMGSIEEQSSTSEKDSKNCSSSFDQPNSQNILEKEYEENNPFIKKNDKIPSYRSMFSNLVTKEVKERKLNKEKIKKLLLQKAEKRNMYGNIVREVFKAPPEVSLEEERLRQIEKLRHKPREKKNVKDIYLVKNLKVKKSSKRKKINKSLSDKIIQVGELNNNVQKKENIDYLKRKRNTRLINDYKALTNWKNDLYNEKITPEEKYERVIEKAHRIEENANKLELLYTYSNQKNPEIKEDIGEMLVNSVNAKLKLFDQFL